MTALNPVRYRMLYGCAHMATVGVKGLRHSSNVAHWALNCVAIHDSLVQTLSTARLHVAAVQCC